MTIIKTQWRIKDGYTSPIDILSSTLASALESPVIYELGYGGSVIDITPTRVQVLTNVMGCEDHTIFEGKEREMRPLVEISALFLKCSFDRLIGKEERNEYEDYSLQKNFTKEESYENGSVWYFEVKKSKLKKAVNRLFNKCLTKHSLILKKIEQYWEDSYSKDWENER